MKRCVHTNVYRQLHKKLVDAFYITSSVYIDSNLIAGEHDILTVGSNRWDGMIYDINQFSVLPFKLLPTKCPYYNSSEFPNNA